MREWGGEKRAAAKCFSTVKKGLTADTNLTGFLQSQHTMESIHDYTGCWNGEALIHNAGGEWDGREGGAGWIGCNKAGIFIVKVYSEEKWIWYRRNVMFDTKRKQIISGTTMCKCRIWKFLHWLMHSLRILPYSWMIIITFLFNSLFWNKVERTDGVQSVSLWKRCNFQHIVFKNPNEDTKLIL